MSFVTTQPEALMASAVPVTATALRADVVICTYSLLGLMHPAPGVPNVDDWAERGISLRDFTKDAAR
jgi:hypothetical protein